MGVYWGVPSPAEWFYRSIDRDPTDLTAIEARARGLGERAAALGPRVVELILRHQARPEGLALARLLLDVHPGWVHAEHPDGRSFLRHAVAQGHPDLARLLVERGATPLENLPRSAGRDAWRLALAFGGDPECRDALALACLTSPRFRAGGGRTLTLALGAAVAHACPAAVRTLLERGATLWNPDDPADGWARNSHIPAHFHLMHRPLALACAHPEVGVAGSDASMVFKLLLGAAGAPGALHADWPSASTPAHVAAAHGQPAVLRALVARGSLLDPPLAYQDPRPITPLMMAAMHGKAAAVRALLAMDAVPGQCDATGRHVFHFLAQSPTVTPDVDLLDVAEVLVHAGVDPWVADRNGLLPTDYPYARPAVNQVVRAARNRVVRAAWLERELRPAVAPTTRPRL